MAGTGAWGTYIGRLPWILTAWRLEFPEGAPLQEESRFQAPREGKGEAAWPFVS